MASPNFDTMARKLPLGSVCVGLDNAAQDEFSGILNHGLFLLQSDFPTPGSSPVLLGGFYQSAAVRQLITKTLWKTSIVDLADPP
ncbi:MAG: hypothetical protein R3F31_25485 [Verrucomicrobiales bacterium]